MTKKQFIQDEIWLLSTLGGFQRSNAYVVTSNENERKLFKDSLRKFIDENVLEFYDFKVPEIEHLKNILSIQEFTKKFDKLLVGGKLNFGITQKVFNLYLKYLWCLELIEIPPHFPVDSIIQGKLGIYNNPWTKFENAEPYIYAINIAKKKLEDSDFKSLAELELILFKR